MKQSLMALLLCLSVLAPAPAQTTSTAPAAAPSWEAQLRQALYGLSLEAEDAAYAAGICIYDLTTDSLLFGYNHHKVMRPASTQKLLTAVAALDQLGPNHTYSTRAYIDGTRSADGRVLYGNLCIVGDFDPAFSMADLTDMARAVRALGIDSISGQIIADVSMKDTLQLGNGWCWDDVPSTIVPYLSPLLVNHGQPVQIRNGKCMPHPELYFLQIFAGQLRDQGVRLPTPVNVSIATQPAPTRRGQLVFHRERTIGQVLVQMMKKSDNLYAESMFFKLAALQRSTGATWKDGARAVETVLQKAGVDIQTVQVADGSGLSLYNYVTPQAEVAILRYAFRNAILYNSLYHSLPIAGTDGTLERRMTNGAAHGNVHAKTGTVTGVSSLAGYVRASNGHTLAFSIILNGVLKNSVGHSLQDRICQQLAQ